MKLLYPFIRLLALLSFIFLADSAWAQTIRFDSLGQGDAIRIIFYPDSGSFLNGRYPIDNEGNIVLPLLGKTNISAMDEREIVGFLNKAFVDQLRYPNVQIQPLIRIAFIGGFHQPGFYYLDPGASLWAAVGTAGGPVREDGLHLMRWERHGEILSEQLGPGLESGRSLRDLGFKSGDQIWVNARPRQQGWDTFNTKVLPGLTFLVSTLTASVTLYFTYRYFYR